MRPVCDFDGLFAVLDRHRVRYIVIGGVAATVHGDARVTLDMDICYDRADDNLGALAEALKSIGAYLRGAPPGLPFRPDFATLKAGLNFTFTTVLGPLDILGEVAGVGDYAAAAQDALEGSWGRHRVRVLSLAKLIASKKAVGRPKDQAALVELEAIQRARQAKPPGRGRDPRA